uniref:Uncharacterized protein n=1 Tax=Ditylenchus dipsaci TaxID=166011 RepID=A0A915CS71_9BILA
MRSGKDVPEQSDVYEPYLQWKKVDGKESPKDQSRPETVEKRTMMVIAKEKTAEISQDIQKRISPHKDEHNRNGKYSLIVSRPSPFKIRSFLLLGCYSLLPSWNGCCYQTEKVMESAVLHACSHRCSNSDGYCGYRRSVCLQF